jgi:putative acetyltransferase
MSNITISRERPDSDDAQALVTELDAYLIPLSPKESRHGYPVDKLIKEDVPFFIIRKDGIPAGCGGLKLFGTDYAEIKRMYVRPQFRGLGMAKLMLDHLAEFAHASGVALLRLETGIAQHEAIGLYERAGFQLIAPFGEYQPDPLSRFYEKRIV